MSDLAPFPNVEAVLMDLLSDLGTTDTDTPPDLQSQLPFIRIKRATGGDSMFFDSPHVTIDAFDATYDEAQSLAESIRQRLIRGPHVQAPGVLDGVTTDSGPAEIPWGDTGIRRFVASYAVSTRR